MRIKINLNKRIRNGTNKKIYPTIILIEKREGEYKYIPRRFTFSQNTRLAYEEVLAIADKLKELNMEVKNG